MRIVLADDHTLFRRSLKNLLEAKGFQVVGEAERGDLVIDTVRRCAPDIVLMDLDMPQPDGILVTRRLLAEMPGTRVVVLTGSYDESSLLRALEAGAQGYLMKTVEPGELFAALEKVVAGEPVLPPGLAHRALTRLASAPGPGGRRKDPLELTEREREVLALLAGGVTSTRALARRLGVSQRTVKFHVGNVLDKLQVGSRAEAVSLALREGLVEPTEEG
ncbi:MAG TPA: response regulator transcription factor [Thermoanaerobaculia bacterium]|nr:response regulator transcription factor [Thermoanaerobaculia bacterium]